ncbi:DUF1553 domain-containing protein [Tichowtungia aerotolerans]|uniref:DUF1553 domain-containing protein n=1 Tax=Tichowtungia aerotolerans TaxID=2697043 RepID=A0A6P1M518_9BACT|nr:DUF1553 domain-containing protein [Tichowtungia aerotolerans]QHI68937.1 DUF1553 domain-containing protein [Tichowtungia aerotolerans]
MKKSIWFILAILMAVLPANAMEESTAVFEREGELQPANQIDRIVFKKLASLNIEPVLCSDAVFLRRAYLDILGKIPTAEEVRRFINTPYSKNKRSELIDELLARPEFADYWSMRWADILRVKAEFPINLWPNAAQAYHHWVHTAIAEDMPYDQMVREMLTASGSNFRVGPVNFYRAIQNKTPEGIATVVALTFMGARAEEWPKEQLANLSAFFSQIGYKPTNEWKEEYVFWDPLGTTKTEGNSAPGSAKITTVVVEKNTNQPPQINREPQPAFFPDGTAVELTPDRDPREVFADWLITPENPWFCRSLVNRTWAWLLGRGIIHEPDDIREDNPPSNPELLVWLEQDFAANKYDMKRLIRQILNSRTYQLSSVSNTEQPQTFEQFGAYPLRRLEAEVLIDAVNAITGSSDLYTSAIPEPFTYIPKDQAAVAIADGSITSPFLALFGRSARATGMWNERDNQTSAPQWRHMLNSGHIQEKLEKGPNLREMTLRKYKPEQIVENLYLSILSRPPTPAETETMLTYGNTANPKPPPKRPGGHLTPKEKKAYWQRYKAADDERMKDWIDIAWALINSPEFLYRH